MTTRERRRDVAAMRPASWFICDFLERDKGKPSGVSPDGPNIRRACRRRPLRLRRCASGGFRRRVLLRGQFQLELDSRNAVGDPLGWWRPLEVVIEPLEHARGVIALVDRPTQAVVFPHVLEKNDLLAEL